MGVSRFSVIGLIDPFEPFLTVYLKKTPQSWQTDSSKLDFTGVISYFLHLIPLSGYFSCRTYANHVLWHPMYLFEWHNTPLSFQNSEFSEILVMISPRFDYFLKAMLIG